MLLASLTRPAVARQLTGATSRQKRKASRSLALATLTAIQGSFHLRFRSQSQLESTTKNTRERERHKKFVERVELVQRASLFSRLRNDETTNTQSGTSRDHDNDQQQQQQATRWKMFSGQRKTNSLMWVAMSLAMMMIAGQPQEKIPYKTFYVTQACEWKSNLFVPKSNDIHFAQQQVRPIATVEGAAGGELPPTSGEFRHFDSHTIFSTSQRALVLALPISLNQNYAGYEPACSIRLIVPRNMRILAKLTSRRLTFEQEQIFPVQQQASTSLFDQSGYQAAGVELNERARASQLWLNVSQNQFSETEEKIVETEGNVLAFRFLLERFANKQVPEIRFQVVLTAFQTYAENSDFNQPPPPSSIAWPPGPPDGGAQQNTQLICDSQRLISVNLACDGFKNCQDGHDEDQATCLALRHNQQMIPGVSEPAPQPPIRNQQDDSLERRSWPVQVFLHLTRDLSPFIAFLVGLLIVLLLLVFCACCCHCLVLLVRRLTWGRSADGDDDDRVRQRRAIASTSGHSTSSLLKRRLRRRLAALRQLATAGWGSAGRGRAVSAPPSRSELSESDSLARGQNFENAARDKARESLVGSVQPMVQQQQQQQRIQSILKRPSSQFKGAAPLARFESIPSGQQQQRLVVGQDYGLQQPPLPPPRALSRPGTAQQQQQRRDPTPQQQTSSPRRGALASSMTSAQRSSGRGRDFARSLTAATDFRPTPVARASGLAPTSSQLEAALPTRDQGPLERQQLQPQVPFHRSHHSQAAFRHQSTRVGQDDGGEFQLPPQQQSSRVSASSSSPPPPPLAAQAESDRLKFKSKTTKLEQTSTVTGRERVTVYEYSSNMARFSESYLLKQHEQRHFERTSSLAPQRSPSTDQPPTTSTQTTNTATATATATATSGAADQQQRRDDADERDLPDNTRQSSLI